MYKISTILTAIGLCLCATFSSAQTTFSVTPAEEEANTSIGDTVTVHVTVTDFTDIATFQFSVNWTPADLTFVSIHSLGLPNYTGGDFGPNAMAGFITTSWSAPGATEYTSPDTCIFAVDFIVETTNGITGDILLTGNPTTIEVVGLDDMGMLNDITSTVTFNGGSATIPIPGGGPSCTFGGQFGQSLDSAEVATGNDVCLTVYACGFTDIVSAQYSINFDPSDLQFSSTQNYNLANLNSSAFNFNNSQGWITFSWLDSLGAGVTVPDLTPIYDICFTAIGSGGTLDTVSFSGTPLSVEVTDAASMGSPIPFNSTPGIVTITGNSASAVTVSGSCETAGPNDEVCVQMTVQNFDSIVGMQYTMHWDTSVLEFLSVGNFASFISAGEFNQINPTTAIFQWNAFPPDPQSLMNGDTLYEICFTIVGDAGETGAFFIDGNPIVEEAIQVVNGSDESVPLITQTCDVQVAAVSSGLNIYASDEEGCPAPADTVYVTYTTTGFVGIASFQYDMTYDNTLLTYLGIVNFNPDLPGSPIVNETSPGNVRISWFEPNVNQVTLNGGNLDTLYQICYLVGGADGTSSTISYNYSNTIEITDGSALVPNTLHDGSVTITNSACDGGPPPNTPTAVVTGVDCNGNATGAIDMSVSGGTMPYTYLWMPGGATTEDISGLTAGTYTVTVTDMNSLTSTQSFVVGEPSLLEATITPMHVTCNGGTNGAATANPTGGSPTYTYLWSTGATTQTATSLGAGSHCVTVTDDSLCTTNLCITINEPTVVTATVSSTPSNCTTDTGTASVSSPSGGSGTGYTYLWDTGATTASLSGVGAGIYCVTVSDDAGCPSASLCTTVGNVAGPTATISVTDANCSGNASGSLTVNPSDGTPGYTYVWSNAGETTQTITGLLPGSYTVTVTDNAGCETIESATVGANAGPSVSATTTEVSCPGDTDGTATATPSGGVSPYTYVWSGGAGSTQTVTDLPAGNYTVTMTDDVGCTAVATETVGTPAAMTASAYVDSDYNGEDISCNGGSDGAVEAAGGGGTGGYSYQWSANAGNATTQAVTDLPQGTYSVTITDDNGCTATDDVFLDDPDPISLSADITDEDSGNDGAIDLSDTGGTGSLSYEWSANAGGATSQDLSGLSAGEYCVTVTDDNDCTMTGCYTVNPPNALDVTLISTTDESCFQEMDGTIEVSSTGVDPLTFAWSAPFGNTNNPTSVGQGTYSVTVTDNNGIMGVLSGILVGGPSEAINATLTGSTDVSCNGGTDGTISINVTGGNGTPYTVAWNGGFAGTSISGLSTGAYIPTITDSNGCTHVGGPFMIDEPAAVGATVDNVVMPGCGGSLDGEIHIIATGGTGAGTYTYNWTLDNNPIAANSADLTGLGAGTFMGTITDGNGCTGEVGPIELVQDGSPVVSLVNAVDLFCAGDFSGAIDVSVSGGTGPGTYTYVWNSGIGFNEDITGLLGGSYTIVVTDGNGCTGSLTTIIDEPAPITVSVNTITPASSANDDGAISMNMPTGGTEPYTYEWTNSGGVVGSTLNISGLPMDQYTLVVTDNNGCTTDIDVLVEGAFQIPPSGVNITHVTCAGGDDGAIDITVFGGTEPYEYIWDYLGQVSPDLSNLPAGSYCVTVTDATGLQAFGCWDVTAPDQLVIQNTTVTHETGNGGNGAIEIVVDGGTVPYSFMWSNGFSGQNPQDLDKGSYQVTITDDNGCILVSNLIDVFPPPLVIEDPIAVSPLCEGSCDGTLSLDVFGGCGPYTFILTGPTNPTPVNDLDGQDVLLTNLCAGNYVLTVEDDDPSSNTPDVTYSFAIIDPEPITISVDNLINNTAGPACNGAINITPDGGTAPYTYQWSNGGTSEDIDGLCNDLSPYCVTVTDVNQCIQVMCGMEIFDAPFVSESQVSNVICKDDENGSVDIVIVEYGLAPYMFMWSSGESTQDINNKPAGVYTVTITDAIGTTSVFSFTISEPSVALVASETTVTVPNGDNPDGAIDISVSGGWGGYEYEWSNGATSMDLGGLLEGDYTVTVTDAGGCEFILGPIELIANKLYLADSEQSNVTCYDAADGFLCVDVAGGTGPGTYTLNWSNGSNDNCIYNLGPDTYTCVATDAMGLSEEFVFVISEPDSLQISFTTEPSTATATAIGGTSPYDYVWNDVGQTNGPTVSDQPTGLYSVVVNDANGCVAISSVEITEALGGECDEVRTILSPNGDNKNATFDVLCARVFDVRLEVFNRWGQLVYEADNYDNTWMAMDASGKPLPEGAYYYVITYEDQDGVSRQAKGYVTVIK